MNDLFIDTDDIKYKSDCSLHNQTQTEINLFGSRLETDLIITLNTPLKNVAVSAADEVIDTFARTNINVLHISTNQINDLPSIETLSLSGDLNTSCMGFSTIEPVYYLNRELDKDAQLNFYTTTSFNDKVFTIEGVLSGSLIASDIIINKLPALKEITFSAPTLDNLTTLIIKSTAPPLIGEIPNLLTYKNIPLSGEALIENTFVVLSEDLTKVLLKTSLPIGEFSKPILSNDNYLHVVAIPLDSAKKGYVFKHINIQGV